MLCFRSGVDGFPLLGAGLGGATRTAVAEGFRESVVEDEGVGLV